MVKLTNLMHLSHNRIHSVNPSQFQCSYVLCVCIT